MTPLHTFQHAFTVSEADIDELGHVNNVAYVRWVQDVAVAHSTAVGLSLAAYRELGAVFVLKRHEIEYLKSALVGQQLLATTFIESATAASCVRLTQFRAVAGGGPLGEAELVAESRTSWVYIRTTNLRPTRISPAVRRAFGVDAPNADPGAESEQP